jgi:hypothetical protein
MMYSNNGTTGWTLVSSLPETFSFKVAVSGDSSTIGFVVLSDTNNRFLRATEYYSSTMVSGGFSDSGTYGTTWTNCSGEIGWGGGSLNTPKSLTITGGYFDQLTLTSFVDTCTFDTSVRALSYSGVTGVQYSSLPETSGDYITMPNARNCTFVKHKNGSVAKGNLLLNSTFTNPLNMNISGLTGANVTGTVLSSSLAINTAVSFYYNYNTSTLVDTDISYSTLATTNPIIGRGCAAVAVSGSNLDAPTYNTNENIFKNCCFVDADFSNKALNRTFHGCDLRGATFANSSAFTLINCNITGANFTGATVSGGLGCIGAGSPIARYFKWIPNAVDWSVLATPITPVSIIGNLHLLVSVYLTANTHYTFTTTGTGTSSIYLLGLPNLLRLGGSPPDGSGIAFIELTYQPSCILSDTTQTAGGGHSAIDFKSPVNGRYYLLLSGGSYSLGTVGVAYSA